MRRANDALSQGQDPVDFWVPDLELGFPEFVYYQHLPHLAIVALDRVLLQQIDIGTVFNATRYVLLVGLPLTVFWSMRHMGFGSVAAAFGAAASSLLSSGGRLGFDYDSYVWRGYGVFTQLVAMHLSFVTLAALSRLLDRGRGYLLAVAAVSALVLSHLLYAYMMAISAVTLVVGTPRRLLARGVRLALVGAIAGVIAAYLILPDLMLGPFQSISPYLERYKYDSFGAKTILGWLLSGQLLDNGRAPVLTLLLGAGILAVLVTRTRPGLIALALFGLWLGLYFGRPTLGGIVDLLPMHQILFFHRFIGGVHLAAILLIGVGGAWLWEVADTGRHAVRLAAGSVVLAALLASAMTERGGYYAQNADWMEQTQAAIARDADAKTILDTVAALPPGRVYAGQRRDWSEELDFGIPFRSVRLYNLLAYREIASFAQPYQGGSLNSDLVFDFDPTNEAHYSVFGVTYVIAPTTRQLPDFLRVVQRTPLYTLYASSASAGARYATGGETIRVPSQGDLFDAMRAWVLGADPATGRVLRFDYPAAPLGRTAVPVAGCVSGGAVSDERIEQSRVSVVADCASPATLVIPVTFHPNWHVSSDGVPLETYMVSPSVLGVTVPAGRHQVVAEYRSTPIKTPLLIAGGVMLAAVIAGRRRVERYDAQLARRWMAE